MTSLILRGLRIPAAFLFEFDGPNSQVFRVLRRQAGAFGGDGCRDWRLTYSLDQKGEVAIPYEDVH